MKMDDNINEIYMDMTFVVKKLAETRIVGKQHNHITIIK